MVATVTYDEHSFWAGVAIGRRLKGYSAYGTMTGWDPEGDLILRPITQGIGRLHFKAKNPRFTVRGLTDTLGPVLPVHEAPVFTETLGRITFRNTHPFTIRAINERLALDEVIREFNIDADHDPMEYDRFVVGINDNGAFAILETAVDPVIPQELTCTVPIGHASIFGIKQLTAEYGGRVELSCRTDGDWSAPVALSDWIAQDAAALYESWGGAEELRLKFLLYDGAAFSRFKIQFIN